MLDEKHYMVNSFATSKKYIYAGASFDGLLRSSDNGKSWTHLGLKKILIH